ncbi:3-alpha-mycarosylerythronolide B desosaminyl tra nsferase [Micromonospora saelicesensis]|uniref:3-alpha-mycarosylerythronolide B desosaminyl tra nsferase n=1 Tax=Micromonospora saelicesensis TaxID=285676 RepID=A0A328NVS7_9ACTN|nr:nucleotide disphospho-sugar-binding domain-containing protein [Micromonospora saelicesensis]RAO34224.1 3-alpha-mycarosylerythronolide B desosaminyl tra nsferase [Micromonospora saelicesensis]
MAKVIVGATPFQGHVSPVLTVAADLVGRGHEVVVYTGSRFEERALAIGARFRALPPEADLDDRMLDTVFPARATLPPGPAQLSFDFENFFLGHLPAQLQGLLALLAEFPADVVLGELGFWSIPVLSLAMAPEERPTLVTLGSVPLLIQSEDTPAFGLGVLPTSGQEARARNRAMNAEARQIFAALQTFGEATLKELGVTLSEYLFDAPFRRTDHYLQLTVPGFEYPRSDLPAHLRFVGTLPPSGGNDYEEPAWWPELSAGRPVVVVTQGTVANNDLNDLVIPTVRALADLDVLVVAATAREDGPALARQALHDVPDNVRLASFVPFDRLLPHADALVTNGGYGGVQTALYHGVPLVVAGASEDKPEVAARVEWTGTGVNLRTSTPGITELRAAVQTVLNDPGYRSQARVLAKEIGQYDPFDAIADIIDGTTQTCRVGR